MADIKWNRFDIWRYWHIDGECRYNAVLVYDNECEDDGIWRDMCYHIFQKLDLVDRM